MADAPAPPPGAGVDARGVPVIDPTRNVLDLVGAAIQRQDDLRKVHGKGMRRELGLHITYGRLLAQAESARLDAIHAADEAARTREAVVNAAQQATLAKQVTDTAVALSSQVETQRVSTAEALSTALLPIQTTLGELTKALYAGQGGVAATHEAKADKREGTANYQWAFQAAVTLIGILIASITLYAALHR